MKRDLEGVGRNGEQEENTERGLETGARESSKETEKEGKNRPRIEPKATVNHEDGEIGGEQQRYFLRKLNALHIDKNILFVFHDSFVKSVMTFSVICWWGNVSIKNREK